MKAIVLAAGRGERMRPLTDRVPKPLLRAGGASLIEWQIARLVAAGIRDIVVNVSHLGEMIEAALGNGAGLGVSIRYSREPQALETAGGIAQALPLLGNAPFVALNADVYCEYDYATLADAVPRLDAERPGWCAYLVLVDNPGHHPRGDFTLGPGNELGIGDAQRLTFSGIGLYRPEFFASIAPGSRRALGPMLLEAASAGCIYGERFGGRWLDVGTPERLAQLEALLLAESPRGQ
jgi:MurNAc alpha-1-phosphate uridylyltransferase